MKTAHALLALIVLAGFLLILVVEVPEPDLIAVAALTFILALVDFLRGMAASRNK